MLVFLIQTKRSSSLSYHQDEGEVVHAEKCSRFNLMMDFVHCEGCLKHALLDRPSQRHHHFCHPLNCHWHLISCPIMCTVRLGENGEIFKITFSP